MLRSSDDIRAFLLAHVAKDPRDLASKAAGHFSVSRQAISKHLRKLVLEKALLAEGNTRQRSYRLAPMVSWRKSYPIIDGLEEDQAWRDDIAPAIGNLDRNLMEIWHFCVTEMFNNAVDHSTGTEIQVLVTKTAVNTQVLLHDNGVGIFRKIKAALNLADERHAILELSKGKLTTDPTRHTGQGIFFTSRLLDSFVILSGGVSFSHQGEEEGQWLMQPPEDATGTTIQMILNNCSDRTCKSIFDQYSSGENYEFTRTVIEVKRAQYGDERLISRSQAKRLLARVDQFTEVVFDFRGVETIGPAFADEIFRVFAKAHPGIEIIPLHATVEVQRMIQGARSRWGSEVPNAI